MSQGGNARVWAGCLPTTAAGEPRRPDPPPRPRPATGHHTGKGARPAARPEARTARGPGTSSASGVGGAARRSRGSSAWGRPRIARCDGKQGKERHGRRDGEQGEAASGSKEEEGKGGREKGNREPRLVLDSKGRRRDLWRRGIFFCHVLPRERPRRRYAGHGQRPRRHDPWRRDVIPRRHDAWRRPLGSISAFKFSRGPIVNFFQKKSQIVKN